MIHQVTASGFGALIGPFCGGFLYQLGGYILPLYLFGAINTILICVFLSKMRNPEVSEGFKSVSGQNKEHAAVQDQNDANLRDLSFGDIFGFRYSAFGYLSKFFAHFALAFTMPLCSTEYYTRGIKPWFFGIVLSFASITFILGAKSTKKLLEKRNRRDIIFTGCLV